MNINTILFLLISIFELHRSMAFLAVKTTTDILKSQPLLNQNVTKASVTAKETNQNDDNVRYNNRGNSRQNYVDNSRNKKRSINATNKMDRTIIGAIVIGSIFLFITLSITVTVIIFCLKKNTVFVFQKSEQEDINDCTYDDCVDAISCQSSLHYFDRPCSALHSTQSGFKNHYSRPCVNEFLEQCPVELFYPMHYDKPCPTQFSQFRRHSQRKCRCYNLKHQLPPESGSANYRSNQHMSDPTVWEKLHDGSNYHPLFTAQSTAIAEPFANVEDVKITLDFIANRRVVTTNQPDKTSIDDKPLLQEFTTSSNNDPGDLSSQIILTPLGKSQTFTELNPIMVDKSIPTGNSQMRMSVKLTKSTSNYDTRVKNNRKY